MTDTRQRCEPALCSASDAKFLQLQGDRLRCPHLTSDNAETQRGERLSHTDYRGTKPGADPHSLTAGRDLGLSQRRRVYPE